MLLDNNYKLFISWTNLPEIRNLGLNIQPLNLLL